MDGSIAPRMTYRLLTLLGGVALMNIDDEISYATLIFRNSVVFMTRSIT